MDAGAILQFAAMIVAVAALALLVHMAGFSAPARLEGPAEAEQLARLAPGGFEPTEIVLDQAGNCAICRDREGALLLLAASGGQFVPLRIDESASFQKDGSAIVIRPGNQTRRSVRFALPGSVPPWLQQLADSDMPAGELAA